MRSCTPTMIAMIAPRSTCLEASFVVACGFAGSDRHCLPRLLHLRTVPEQTQQLPVLAELEVCLSQETGKIHCLVNFSSQRPYEILVEPCAKTHQNFRMMRSRQKLLDAFEQGGQAYNGPLCNTFQPVEMEGPRRLTCSVKPCPKALDHGGLSSSFHKRNPLPFPLASSSPFLVDGASGFSCV